MPSDVDQEYVDVEEKQANEMWFDMKMKRYVTIRLLWKKSIKTNYSESNRFGIQYWMTMHNKSDFALLIEKKKFCSSKDMNNNFNFINAMTNVMFTVKSFSKHSFEVVE